MKKQLRIVCCCVTIFAFILLTACKDFESENSENSVQQNGTYIQYESSNPSSSKTDSIASESANTEQIESSDTNNSTITNTKPDISVNSDADIDKSTSSASYATSTPSNVHTHSYNSKKIAATCTKDGYTLKTCACGHSEKSAKVSSLGHSWGNWTTVKVATATSNGLQRRTCTRCGATDERVLEKSTQSTGNLQLEILQLVNEERAKQGLNALQYYSAGQAAADIRATEIDTVFSHTRPNGTSCFTALDELGIKYRSVGENIAKGQPTATAVMEDWKNSKGHRENILNANFTHIIVGVNGKCWVQLFLTI